MISTKLQSNFIEIALRRGCSSVNLLHIFRTPFPNDNSGGLFLIIPYSVHEILMSYYKNLAANGMLYVSEC